MATDFGNMSAKRSKLSLPEPLNPNEKDQQRQKSPTTKHALINGNITDSGNNTKKSRTHSPKSASNSPNSSKSSPKGSGNSPKGTGNSVKGSGNSSKGSGNSPKGSGNSPKGSASSSPKGGGISPKGNIISPKIVIHSPKNSSSSPKGNAHSPKAKGGLSPKGSPQNTKSGRNSPKNSAHSPKGNGVKSPKSGPTSPKVTPKSVQPHPKSKSQSPKGKPQSPKGSQGQQKLKKFVDNNNVGGIYNTLHVDVDLANNKLPVPPLDGRRCHSDSGISVKRSASSIAPSKGKKRKLEFTEIRNKRSSPPSNKKQKADSTGSNGSPSPTKDKTVDHNQNIQVVGIGRGQRRNSWDNSLHSPDQYKSIHSIGSRKAVMKVATYSDTILTSTRKSLPACQPTITNGAVDSKTGVQVAALDLSMGSMKDHASLVAKQGKESSAESKLQRTAMVSSKPDIVARGESETSVESDPADKYEKVDTDILFKKEAIAQNSMMESEHHMENEVNSTNIDKERLSSTPSSDVFEEGSDKDKRSMTPASDEDDSAFSTDGSVSTGSNGKQQTKEKQPKRVPKKYADLQPRAPRKRRMASLTAETKNLVLFDKDLTAPLPTVKKPAEGRGRKRKRVEMESQTSQLDVSDCALLVDDTTKGNNTNTADEQVAASKDTITSKCDAVVSVPSEVPEAKPSLEAKPAPVLVSKDVKPRRTQPGNIKSGNSKAKSTVSFASAKKEKRKSGNNSNGRSKSSLASKPSVAAKPASVSKASSTVSKASSSVNKLSSSVSKASTASKPSSSVSKSSSLVSKASLSVSKASSSVSKASSSVSKASSSVSKASSSVSKFYSSVSKLSPSANSKPSITSKLSSASKPSSSVSKLSLSVKKASSSGASDTASPVTSPSTSKPTTAAVVSSSPSKSAKLILSRRSTVDVSELSTVTSSTSITTPLLLRMSRHSTDGTSSSEESLLPSPSGFDPVSISLLKPGNQECEVIWKRWTKPGGILTGNFNGQSASSNHYIPKSRVLKKIIKPPNLKSKITSKRHSTNGWKVMGEPVAKPIILLNETIREVRLCYQSIKRKEDVIQVRDCVMLRSGVKRKDLPFVAKVSALWEDPESGEIMMSLLWYYRPEHTEGGRKPVHSQNELFACRHWDINSVACIEDKCYVLTPAEYNRYCTILQMRREKYVRGMPVVPDDPNGYPRQHRLPRDKTDPESVFLCRQVYDFRQKRILKNPY